MGILKLNKKGEIEWFKSIGGNSIDVGYFVHQNENNTYFVLGRTESFGLGFSYIWVIKLSSEGNIIWQKVYGTENADFAKNIIQTTDGGYIISGRIYTLESHIDMLLFKIDQSGDILWSYTNGGWYMDSAESIQQTSDGGFIVLGNTSSFSQALGNQDICVLKLTSDGSIQWQKSYYIGNAHEHGHNVIV